MTQNYKAWYKDPFDEYSREKCFGRTQRDIPCILQRDTLAKCVKDTLAFVGRGKPFQIYKFPYTNEDIVYDSDYPELYNDQTKDNPEENTMTEKTLYEIKDAVSNTTQYGFKLAVNSQGQWVMEIKGSGDVVAVDKKSVTEVMPYTISVQYSDGGQPYHYFNEARDLVVDDFFINAATYDSTSKPYQIGRVTAVDTKSKAAKAELKYFKKL